MPDSFAPGQTAPSAHPAGGTDYLYSLNRDLKALNASVLVITQKIKYLVRNEKILGRNLIVINKRVKELSSQISVNQGQGMSEEMKQLLADVSRQTSALSSQVLQLEAKLETMQQRSASAEEVRELKYIVDAINPLHFITRDQVEELIERRMREKK